jgi:hypothetical protein
MLVVSVRYCVSIFLAFEDVVAGPGKIFCFFCSAPLFRFARLVRQLSQSLVSFVRFAGRSLPYYPLLKISGPQKSHNSENLSIIPLKPFLPLLCRVVAFRSKKFLDFSVFFCIFLVRFRRFQSLVWFFPMFIRCFCLFLEVPLFLSEVAV